MSRECAMQEASGTGRWTRQAQHERPPVGQWASRAARLPEPVRETLAEAERTAAANGWDVHFWQRGEWVAEQSP